MSATRDAYTAIADPTRRAILEVLRDEASLTAGQLAQRFPTMSRPAVSKHLAVLREAGLVKAREEGREWHYTLDPTPLAEIYERWLLSFVPLWDESLRRLKRKAEKSPRKGAR